MERSRPQELVNSSTSDEAVLELDAREQLLGDLHETRGQLAGEYAERSRRLVEGATSAEAIRQSTEEVTDYINGLATDMYIRLTEEDGVSHDDAVARIDAFIAEQTHLLLGEMAEKRTTTARAHNRFMPKFVGDLYDKFVETWRSWEVPKGDGELVSRLRETGMWQHLEKKSEGATRGAKLGKFALTAFASAINGVENLKYSGARKRLMTMAGIGVVSGAAAGVVLGAVGAGAAGALMGGITARSMVRSGLGTKLNSDANIEQVSLYDQVRMQGRVNQLTAEAYSVDELLSYVDDETKKMLYENDAKLMGGIAIGIAGGLLGNGVARGMGWLASQYIDANFNAVARADVLYDDEANHVIENINTAPHHVIDGSPENTASHVIDGATPNHVIDGYEVKTRPDHVVDGGHDKDHPNHVIDGSKKVSDHTAEKPSSKDTFMVESGHGFIREIQDYAKENGYSKVSAVDAYEMYKQLLKEHDENGLIDVHGIKNDTYVENGDVRISASGEAHWRTGVQKDIDSLMHQHERGDRLTLHAARETSRAGHVVDGSPDKNHPNHVIDGYDPATKSSLSEPISVINGAVENAQEQGFGDNPVSVIEGTDGSASDHLSTINSFTAKDLNIYSDDTKSYREALAGVAPNHRADVLRAAATELQSFKLTEKIDGVWRFREVNTLPPKAIELLSRIATKNHWTLTA